MGLSLLGFFRAELGSLLWGAAFLFLSLYLGIANLIQRAVLAHSLKRSPSPPEYRVEAARVYEGDSLSIRVEGRVSRFFMPGIASAYRVGFVAKDRRSIDLACPARELRNGSSLRSGALPRGSYERAGPVMEIRDLLSLTRTTIPLKALSRDASTSESSRIEALPLAIPYTGLAPHGSGGEERRRAAGMQRSTELLDSRQYLPGDDPRRLNWKAYGRFGELFTRQGELSPPPESRTLVILNTELPTGMVIPGRELIALDVLCGIALGLVERFSIRGGSALLYFQGEAIAEGTDKAASALARAAWDKENSQEEDSRAIAEAGAGRVMMAGLPKTRRAESVAVACARLGISLGFVMASLEEEQDRGKEALLSRILYSKDKASEEKAIALAGYSALLDAEGRLLSKRGFRHVDKA